MEILIVAAAICGLLGLGIWVGYAIHVSRATMMFFLVVLVTAIPFFGAPTARFDGDKFNFAPLILRVISGGLLLGTLLGLAAGAVAQARARRRGQTLPQTGALLPSAVLIVFMVYMSREFIQKFFFATSP